MIRISAQCVFLMFLLLAVAGAQSTEPVTVTYTSNGWPIFIPPDSADQAALAQVIVPDALKITKLVVKLKVQYPVVGDLNVYLFSPDGTRVRLLERNCGNLANIDTTFDDTAQNRYADFCPAEAGRGPFRGNEPLSNFNSAETSFGKWTLAVENNGSESRTGSLNGFGLEITGTRQVPPTFRSDTVLNTGGARTGVIAPGENITVIGVNLGPPNGAIAPQGTLPTTLSGVSVRINGTAIPLKYASNYRIDGQVPFGIPTSGQVSMQIQYNDLTSSTVSLTAQPTFPGIYTTDQLGTGPAKAVNQNGTLNSKGTPATRGEVIIIYASGLGAVNPATAAGNMGPSNPLSVVSQTVAASIGGVPATVVFAGLAPGQNGVYQLNILIPSEVDPGTRDIVISNGGNASQGQVTIEVQ
jgi:uncharacterized protein (TIGR03437 family)